MVLSPRTLPQSAPCNQPNNKCAKTPRHITSFLRSVALKKAGRKENTVISLIYDINQV